MRRLLLLLPGLLLVAACQGASPVTALPPSEPVLRFVQYTDDGGLELVDRSGQALTLPQGVPSSCSLYRLYPDPVGSWLALEFQCAREPLVWITRLEAGGRAILTTWVRENTRFLAWSPDGVYAYLRLDPFGDPRVSREDLNREQGETLDLPAGLYDLAVLPDGRLVYSTTEGLGFGSTTWIAEADGSQPRQLLDWPRQIAAYLRPAPEGSRIAFILFPDSETPFPNGALMLLEDGLEYITDADAGHGYAPAWSPDGSQLAFIRRENPEDPLADLSAGALRSNVYLVEFPEQTLTRVTDFPDAIVESPVWSPDGSCLVFNVIIDGTIQIWQAASGTLQPLAGPGTCCAFWMPGR